MSLGCWISFPKFSENIWVKPATDLDLWMMAITLPKFNSSPLKSYLPNGKVVFQPPFFRGYVKIQFGVFHRWDVKNVLKQKKTEQRSKPC